MNKEINEKIIICDIDGCLIETSWIWELNKTLKLNSPECWEFFENNANSSWNKVDSFLLFLLKDKLKQGYKIVFITARSKNISEGTIKLIEEKTGLSYGLDFDIYFRALDDSSEPWEYKGDCVDVYFKNKQIALAIDDDKRIVEMYKNKGINAIRWAFGFIPPQFLAEYNSIPFLSLNLEVK